MLRAVDEGLGKLRTRGSVAADGGGFGCSLPSTAIRPAIFRPLSILDSMNQ